MPLQRDNSDRSTAWMKKTHGNGISEIQKVRESEKHTSFFYICINKRIIQPQYSDIRHHIDTFVSFRKGAQLEVKIRKTPLEKAKRPDGACEIALRLARNRATARKK